MAIKLFISPSIMAQTTVLGGNVDPDKFTFNIEEAQVNGIEPMLGTELFDKMIDDLTFPPTYSGLYEILYDEFIVPITKNIATANYIAISPYVLSNAGLFKNSPDNAEIVDKEEAEYLANRYSHLAQNKIIRFNKWIGLNPIPEYKTSQDEVNADNNIQLPNGWWFGE